MDYFLAELDHQLWELALHSNSLLDRAFAVKILKLALLAFRKLIFTAVTYYLILITFSLFTFRGQYPESA